MVYAMVVIQDERAERRLGVVGTAVDRLRLAHSLNAHRPAPYERALSAHIPPR